MTIGLVGRKCGMTRVFTDAGETVPVTVIEALPNRVTQSQVRQADGYRAVQVTMAAAAHRGMPRLSPAISPRPMSPPAMPPGSSAWGRRRSKASPSAARSRSTSSRPARWWTSPGTTLGKGFAGAMKRHNFGGLPASHGVSVSHRSPGSIGQRQTPGRVFKGSRMSGPHGRARRTIENLKVVQVDVAAQSAPRPRRRAGLGGRSGHRPSVAQGGADAPPPARCRTRRRALPRQSRARRLRPTR